MCRLFTISGRHVGLHFQTHCLAWSSQGRITNWLYLVLYRLNSIKTALFIIKFYLLFTTVPYAMQFDEYWRLNLVFWNGVYTRTSSRLISYSRLEYSEIQFGSATIKCFAILCFVAQHVCDRLNYYFLNCV